MNSTINQQIFALNVAKLIQYIYEQNHSCTLGEAFRTSEQAELYAKEGKGIKNSLHCRRLAIDLNLFSPDDKYLKAYDDYEPFGLYWEELHADNRWGGRFMRLDLQHFEMKEE